MSYKIQFLDNEEFDRLPGDDMASKIGIAYPETNEAYVRKSGMSVVDAFTAAHEIEHLKGNDLDEHYDQENKCYYKKFNQALGQIVPAALSLFGGPPGMAAGAAMKGTNSFGLFGKTQQQVQQENQARDQQNSPMMDQFGQNSYNPYPGGNGSSNPNVVQTQGGGASYGFSDNGGGSGQNSLAKLLGR